MRRHPRESLLMMLAQGSLNYCGTECNSLDIRLIAAGANRNQCSCFIYLFLKGMDGKCFPLVFWFLFYLDGKQPKLCCLKLGYTLISLSLCRTREKKIFFVSVGEFYKVSHEVLENQKNYVLTKEGVVSGNIATPKECPLRWAWWHIPIILVLRRIVTLRLTQATQ